MKSINEIRTENLTFIFKKSGKTQEKFGEPLGASPQQVGQWLNNIPSSQTGKPRVIGHASCRKIEQIYGYPENWMDHEHAEDSALADSNLVVQIPVIDISGDDKTTCAVLKKTLESVNLKISSARIIKTANQNMAPTINKGSQVMLDISDALPSEGGIYLIQDAEHLELKRLIYEYSYLVMDSVWVMKSDNPNKREYPDKFLPQTGGAKIIGRVVWYDNTLKKDSLL